MTATSSFRILKAKLTIQCDCCGCSLPRSKSFKVAAADKESAKIEAREKVAKWTESLRGQNCRVCQSILKDQ
jgi:hypothetical protein